MLPLDVQFLIGYKTMEKQIRIIIPEPSALEDLSYPHYGAIGEVGSFDLDSLPISNATITDLHFVDNGPKLQLNGIFKPTTTLEKKYKVNSHWLLGRDVNVEIANNMQISQCSIEDISFQIDSAHTWSQPFNLNRLLFKEFSSSDFKHLWLSNVSFKEFMLRFKDYLNTWLFQGIIASAEVHIDWTPPPDTKLPWEGRLGVFGKIRNVRCYTKGSSWIVGRPIPKS